MSEVANHQRPNLTPQQSGPDIVDRLQRLIDTGAVLAFTRDLGEAVATINGLRASDARRLTMINDGKARITELETALRGLAHVATWDEDTDRAEFDTAFEAATKALGE